MGGKAWQSLLERNIGTKPRNISGGLSSRDIAAYLHSPLHPTDDFRKTRRLAQEKLRLPQKPVSDAVAMKKQS
jgi:hypothetical protein